jgi:hypothetical protein
VRNRATAASRRSVQGDGAAVLAMVAWSERGPPGAHVSDVEVSDAAPDPALGGFSTIASG